MRRSVTVCSMAVIRLTTAVSVAAGAADKVGSTTRGVLIRLEEDKPVPNVYVYSNGVTKPYKNYTDLKDIVMDFPGMMTSNNSTKEEMVSVMKKGDKFYEIT